MSRKKSCKSTSFRFTEIGSPENFWGALDSAWAAVDPVLSEAGTGDDASEEVTFALLASSDDRLCARVIAAGPPCPAAEGAGTASADVGCVNATGRMAAGAGMIVGITAADLSSASPTAGETDFVLMIGAPSEAGETEAPAVPFGAKETVTPLPLP